MHLAIVCGKTLSISNAQRGFVIKPTKIFNFKISIKVYQLNQFRCVVERFFFQMQVEKLSQTHEIGFVSMYNQITTSNFKIRQRKLISRNSNKNFFLPYFSKKKRKTETPKKIVILSTCTNLLLLLS